MSDLFIRGIKLSIPNSETKYPFSIPAVRSIQSIEFTSPTTFLVGENGSGKSTILEAIAVAGGFNAEGGTKNYNYSTEDTTSELSNAIRLARGIKREKYGYFLRAESFYTTANYAETGTFPSGNTPSPILFDGKRIHQQSHGEAFLSIVESFRPGLFIFDEPESALSPKRLMKLMFYIKELQNKGSQFIISTHSPILLAYPNANIYQLSDSGVAKIQYEDIEHVQLTKDFLNNPSAFTERIFNE